MRQFHSSLSILVLALVIAMTANAQTATDELKLKDAVELLRKAMISADQGELEKLTADQLSYGHSSGKVENKKSFIDALVTGQSDFVDIVLSDQTIEVTDNVAIVRHKLSGNTNDKGKAPGTVNIGVLLVWYKFRNDWKLVARQAFKL